MLVLNDIELIKFLRPLNLLKNGEFLISNIFMTKNYLDVVERQALNILAEQEKIILFESGDNFYNFFSEHTNEKFPIGLAGMSSIYHSMVTNSPLVSKCNTIKKFARERDILVYNFEEALRHINTGEEKINYINTMLNTI